jgi:hypothetical protein
MKRFRRFLAVGPHEPAAAVIGTLILAILIILGVAAGFRP